MRCKRPIDFLARLPKGVNEDFGARRAVVALITDRQRQVAIDRGALIRRSRGGGHPLVAGVRCKRPVDLLARLPKGVNEDFGARRAVVALITDSQHHVAIDGGALSRRSRGGGHPLVAGVRCKRPIDLLAQLLKGVNEDFGARRALVALIAHRQRHVAIAGGALTRRSRGGGHPLVAGVRCKRPIDLLARLPKGVNEGFGARRAVVALITRPSAPGRDRGGALSRRSRGGGHPLVAGVRCKRPVDLLARPPKGVNEDFGARRAVVALITDRQRHVEIAGGALTRRSRGGGHPLVAGVRCKRPIDLLAQLPKR